MTRPSATCELWLDGARVPDTGQALLEGTPTALDALALTWGRDGANEQPGPATCSFRILDQTPNPDFLDELHVGSTVAVWAQGQIPGAALGWVQTMDGDGRFEIYPLGGPIGSNVYYPLNVVKVKSGSTISWEAWVRDHGGSHVIGLEPRPGVVQSATVTVDIPPRPFGDGTGLPDIWDDIPRGQSGQVWKLGLDVYGLPPGLIVTVQAGYIQLPYGSINSTFGPVQTITSDGTWKRVEWTATYGAATRYWVGLRMVVSGWDKLTWAAQTGTWAEQTTTWQAWTFTVHLDNGFIGRPGGDTSTRRVLVFSGSITDMAATPVGDGTLEASFTAADLGAELGNRVIGDEPWPVTTLAMRALTIANLAEIASPIRIDAPFQPLQVTARDVDAQPAYQLLQDLAQTAGGVLWGATHSITGPYLWIENPALRTPLAELTLTGGLIVITGSSENNTLISACDLLEDPIRWHQDTQDVATVAAVTWLEQGTDDEGQLTTTERTETITDAAGLAQYGTRRLSVSTELINSTDATNLANRLLASARAVGWRISGLTLDTDAGPEDLDSIGDDQREIALMNMLDGTTRMGLGVVLVDMPAYAPRGAISSVYLEGGTYTFDQGAWTLALGASPGSAQGSSVKWGQLDATWRWNQWAPTITYQSLFGVAP